MNYWTFAVNAYIMPRQETIPWTMWMQLEAKQPIFGIPSMLADGIFNSPINLNRNICALTSIEKYHAKNDPGQQYKMLPEKARQIWSMVNFNRLFILFDKFIKCLYSIKARDNPYPHNNVSTFKGKTTNFWNDSNGRWWNIQLNTNRRIYDIASDPVM